MIPRPPGCNAKLGDRIIEIGCVEVLSRRVSERHFHAYLNPEREVDAGRDARARPDARGPRRQAEVRRDRAGLPRLRPRRRAHHPQRRLRRRVPRHGARAAPGWASSSDHVARITDTLAFARELHPGKRNSLDALCERYFIDNSKRTLHGALARRAAAGRVLPRDDARPGEPDDGAGGTRRSGRGGRRTASSTSPS